MQIKQMKEGTHYILGFADKSRPEILYQMDVSSSELRWKDSDSFITGFGSVELARQAKEIIEKNFGMPVSVYRVVVQLEKVP